ncbi:MAG: hypothetical protein KDD66_09395 [Bdellovibrionales bacterium]|nr:hypothetical protein [Bdellovibrionales bacterium]
MKPSYGSPQEMLLRLGTAALLFVCLLAAAFQYYASIPLIPNLIYLLNTLNFIIHEIGHPIFGMLGEFIGYAGGTIFQLLVPAVFVIVSISQGYQLGIWFFVFWFGQNFIHISKYIADARAHELTLFTPAMLSQPMSQQEVHKHHDWSYMLTKLGLLEFDIAISWLVFGAGVLIMLTAAIGAALNGEGFVRRKWNEKFSRE